MGSKIEQNPVVVRKSEKLGERERRALFPSGGKGQDDNDYDDDDDDDDDAITEFMMLTCRFPLLRSATWVKSKIKR